MDKGVLVVVSGPSGAGKSTVIHKVFEKRNDLYFSVSATTRPPREGEIDAVDYHFISPEAFREMIDNHRLLEFAQYVDNFYGTPCQPVEEALMVGKNVILDIEVQGAAQIMTNFPEAIGVFLCPPSLEELEKRLRYRGTDSEEKIMKRILTARDEYKKIKNYNYIVINEDADIAAEELNAIITAGRCRTNNRINKISKGVDIL